VGDGKSKRQALYFPSDMLQDIQGEAERQDRSISWLIQQAWRIARNELRKVPSTTDYFEKLEGDPDGSDGSDS
jgi:uncharacterized small protein (TIGR04563 family)